MQIISKLETLMAWSAAVLLTLTGVLLSYEVVARYFFNAPTVWAAELSQLCLIWACPLAMGWALTHHRHIRVTALTAQMSPGLRRVAELVTLLVVLAFALVVLRYGWDIFIDSFGRGRTSGTMLDLPAWYAEAAVPVGFALLSLSALAAMIRILRGEPLTDNESLE